MTADDYVAMCQRLFHENKLNEARQACHEALRLKPKHTEAQFMAAVLAFYSGDDVELEGFMNQVVRARPNRPQYLGFFGSYHKHIARYADAEAWFSKAASKSGAAPDIWNDLGEVQLAQDKFDAAMRSFKRAARPGNHRADTGLGAALLGMGETEQAVTCLRRALEQGPDNPLTLARLSLALLESGQVDAARTLLEGASADREPELHKAFWALYRAEGREADAAIAYGRYADLAHGLEPLAKRYRTDKIGVHNYVSHYHEHLRHLRDREVTVLEIGVGGYESAQRGGASLRMWKDYFPKGRIVAIDIQDKAPIEQDRIRIFRGSQADPQFLESVIAEIGRPDVIIDDGSHINEHVITSFQTLFPHLADDGIYAVEDTQTAYWPQFGGSSDDLNHPDTMLTFFKGLTDGLNHAEYLRPGYTPTYLDQHVVSMHFHHNLVFIHKGDHTRPGNQARNRTRPA